MRRPRLLALLAAASAAVLLPLGGGVAPAEAAGVLDPFGLNNGFGQDPKTERVVTWLGLDKTKYVSPYIKLDVGGVTVSATTSCTQSDITRYLSDYTAYTCTVRGLTAGTTYNYLVGAYVGATAYESPKYSFTTEAASVSEFTFLDFADSQGDEDNYTQFWGNTLSKALSQNPGAVFMTHTGDIVDDVDKDHMMGWLTASGTNLASLAFNPVLGNHDDGSSEGTMWQQLFSRPSLTPAPTATEVWPLQYSQVYGNALFLYINTNMYTTSRLQRTSEWVKQAVAAYGKNPDGTSRFIIVLEHKSPFGGRHSGSGSYPSGDYGNPYIVAELPKTYAEVGVDLVLAGHDHNLIRSQPITWNAATGKATWGTATNASTPLSTIDSGADGLIYYIPRNSGEKTYSLISTPTSSSRPWINWYYKSTDNGHESPTNNVYSAVTVSQTSIQVKTYQVGSSATAGQLLDQFTITQPAQSTLELSQSSWDVQSAAQTLNLGVTGNVAWNAGVTSSSSSWLTVVNTKGSGNGTIQLKVTQNTTTRARTATVTINGQGVPTRTFTVTQQPPTVNWGQTTWTAPMTGGSLTVPVTSNTSWTVSGANSWLSVTPTAGTGDGAVTLTAASKSTSGARSVTLTLRATGATSKTLVVTQPASALTVSPTSLSALVMGGTQTVAVTANVDWTATTTATWLSISGGSGSGNGTFTVTSQAKTTSAARSATISIKGGGITRSLTVTQAANALTVSPATWTVTPLGGTRGINVTSNLAWTVSSDSAWLRADTSSGVGNQILVIEADPKTTTAARTGKLTLTGGGITRTITVTQSASTLTINRTSWNPPSTADSRVVTVTSNTTWQVSSNQSWLTVSPTSGSGNGSFTIAAVSNATYGGTRPTATVTVTGGGITRTITITD